MEHKGFTLTELLMAIVLAVLAMTIMAPPISRGHERATVRAIVAEFIAVHARARSTAVRYGRVVELKIQANKDRFWIEADTTLEGEEAVRLAMREFRRGDLGSDRKLLCFDGRGLPTTRGKCEAADATLTFTLGSRSDTLKITALGVIRR